MLYFVMLIIEGHPDFVVDNDPGKEFAGVDQHLNKGTEVLMGALKTQSRDIPPYPVKIPKAATRTNESC